MVLALNRNYFRRVRVSLKDTGTEVGRYTTVQKYYNVVQKLLCTKHFAARYVCHFSPIRTLFL